MAILNSFASLLNLGSRRYKPVWNIVGRLIAVIIMIVTMLSSPAFAQSAGCDAVGLNRLRPIISTHTIPPYPPDAVRKNMAGVTLLLVRIGPDGVVNAAAVEKTSGYPELDATALNYVKSRWRWTNACSHDLATRVSVKWSLRRPISNLVFGLAFFAIGICMMVSGSSLAFEFPLLGKRAEQLRRHFDETAAFSGVRSVAIPMIGTGIFMLLIGGSIIRTFVRGIGG